MYASRWEENRRLSRLMIWRVPSGIPMRSVPPSASSPVMYSSASRIILRQAGCCTMARANGIRENPYPVGRWGAIGGWMVRRFGMIRHWLPMSQSPMAIRRTCAEVFDQASRTTKSRSRLCHPCLRRYLALLNRGTEAPGQCGPTAKGPQGSGAASYLGSITGPRAGGSGRLCIASESRGAAGVPPLVAA